MLYEYLPKLSNQAGPHTTLLIDLKEIVWIVKPNSHLVTPERSNLHPFSAVFLEQHHSIELHAKVAPVPEIWCFWGAITKEWQPNVHYAF